MGYAEQLALWLRSDDEPEATSRSAARERACDGHVIYDTYAEAATACDPFLASGGRYVAPGTHVPARCADCGAWRTVDPSRA